MMMTITGVMVRGIQRRKRASWAIYSISKPPIMSLKHCLLTLWVLLVYVLHQDFWNWNAKEPLLFGLLLPGLAYHLGYSVLAALTMALLVKFAWPAHLEDGEQINSPRE